MSVALHHRLDGPAGAPVLVLGSSLGTDLSMWDPVVELLSGDFRILRFDLRGQGASPVPAPPYAIADLGADVIALLDALSITQVSYAGVSIGGMVGLWLAANAPARITRLAVFCSSAHPGGPDAWKQRAATVRGADSTAPVAEAVVSRWLTADFAAANPKVVTWLTEMVRASPAAGYAALCEMLATLDLVPDLRRIRVPTLVVAGAQDQALPPDHSKLIALQIATTHRLALLDPGAHIPMVERPQEVAALIREHLEADIEPGD